MYVYKLYNTMLYNTELSSPEHTRRRVITMNYYPPRSRGFYSPSARRCTRVHDRKRPREGNRFRHDPI